MMFKTTNGMAPTYLQDMFTSNIGRSVCNLRTSRYILALPVAKTDYYRKSFAYTEAKVWNLLPEEMRSERSLSAFKNKLASLTIPIEP